MTSRASPQTNLAHVMVPPVLAGAKRISCSEVVCQDSIEDAVPLRWRVFEFSHLFVLCTPCRFA